MRRVVVTILLALSFTGFAQTNHTKNLTILANPLSDYLRVSGPEAIDGLNYVIYDGKGKTLLSGVYTDGKINIYTLPKGVYTIELYKQFECYSESDFIKI